MLKRMSCITMAFQTLLASPSGAPCSRAQCSARSAPSTSNEPCAEANACSSLLLHEGMLSFRSEAQATRSPSIQLYVIEVIAVRIPHKLRDEFPRELLP